MRTNAFLAMLITVIVTTPFFCSTSVVADDSKLVYKSEETGASRFLVGVAKSGLPDGIAKLELFKELNGLENDQTTYAWFVFGDPHSRSIAIASLAEKPDEIFIDLDRDKAFSKKEKLVASNGEWVVTIPAEFIVGKNQYRYQRLQVRIRWNKAMARFELLTLGAMVGEAVFDGQMRSAKYIDHNSNGSWFDPEDRLLIDANGDGKLNPLTERFACRSLCSIEQKQFAISGDKLGRSLEFNELKERGSLIPKLTLADSAAEILEVSASLASRNGIYLRINEIDNPVECPVGEYHVDSVNIKIKSESGVYRYRFAVLEPEGHSVELKANAKQPIELLGKLELTSTQLINADNNLTTLSIIPMMSTESGLYLTACMAGKSKATTENRLIARTLDLSSGKQIALGSTGFS